MKLELTSTQVAEVKPWLNKCRETYTPCVLAGQLMPGDFEEGMKIRKLIQRERETLAKETHR